MVMSFIYTFLSFFFLRNGLSSSLFIINITSRLRFKNSTQWKLFIYHQSLQGKHNIYDIHSTLQIPSIDVMMHKQQFYTDEMLLINEIFLTLHFLKKYFFHFSLSSLCVRKCFCLVKNSLCKENIPWNLTQKGVPLRCAETMSGFNNSNILYPHAFLALD